MNAGAHRPIDVAALARAGCSSHRLGRRMTRSNPRRGPCPWHRRILVRSIRGGMILDDLGRRSDALTDFQRILSINPNHSGAMTNRAILYAERAASKRHLPATTDPCRVTPTNTTLSTIARSYGSRLGIGRAASESLRVAGRHFPMKPSGSRGWHPCGSEKRISRARPSSSITNRALAIRYSFAATLRWWRGAARR